MSILKLWDIKLEAFTWFWLGTSLVLLAASVRSSLDSNVVNQSIKRTLSSSDEDVDFQLVDPTTAVSSTNLKSLLLVGTIDGRLSAFNTDSSSPTTPLWTLDTSPGPLLSSSLSKIEMVRDGEKIRLIPSLDGALFSFNGDRIEPLPVSADTLLSSSFKISEDSVISGAKETKIYGLDIATGKVKYSCAAEGCSTFDGEIDGKNGGNGATLVVKRLTQTVRAFDIHQGRENWNFSVGSLDVTMATSKGHLSGRRECEAKDMGNLVEMFRFDAVTGVVRVERSGKSDEVWEHKFENPITGAWIMHDGCVVPVDVLTTGRDHAAVPDRQHQVIYIGYYEEQLYIKHASPLPFHHLVHKYPQATFRPWLMHAPSRTAPFMADPYRPLVRTDLNNLYFPLTDSLAVVAGGRSDLALAHGYFLVEEDPVVCNNDSVLEVSDSGFFVYSPLLLNWLALAGLVLLPLAALSVFYLFRNHWKLRPPQLLHATSTTSSKSITSVLSLQELNGKTSRFRSDFEVIEQLGEGGFGVVYSAKNRLDDNVYAVKKIRLPKSDEAREKVRREVRVLAKLDHPGIVRFYNAWVESDDVDAPDASIDPAVEQIAQLSGLSTDLDDEWIGTRHCSPFTSRNGDQFPGDVLVENWQDDSAEVVFRDENPSASAGGDQNRSNKTSNSRSSSSDVTVSKGRGKFFKSNSKSSSSSRTTPSLTGLSDLDNFTPPSRLRPQLFIQMELCRKETLRDWLKLHNETRNRLHILDIFHQITRAVEYIHRLGLMHRDLKPSNVLFSLDATAVKIADFGLVTATDDEDALAAVIPVDVMSLHDKNHTNRVGTSLYMSPELISGRGYCEKIDIYSLGLIFLELLVPFKTDMERIVTITEAKKFEFGCLESGNSGCWVREGDGKLLRQLLAVEPCDRPSAIVLCEDFNLSGDFLRDDEEQRGRNVGRKRTRSFLAP